MYNVISMNITQQGEYIAIQQGCQQLKLAICGRNEISAEKSEFYRQVSAQLGRLDYRKLYSAFSGTIRKSQVEPRILFEIIVCAYMKGIDNDYGIYPAGDAFRLLTHTSVPICVKTIKNKRNIQKIVFSLQRA